MEFNCEIHLSEKDYMYFNRYAARKTLWIALSAYFVIVFLIMAMILYQDCFHHDTDLLLSFAVALVFTVLVGLTELFVLNVRVKAAFQSNRLLKNKTKVSIDGHGIQESSAISELKISYGDVYKVGESKHGIYIFVAKNVAIIIPKRVLDGGGSEKLSQLIYANMDGSKVKLCRPKRT